MCMQMGPMLTMTLQEALVLSQWEGRHRESSKTGPGPLPPNSQLLCTVAAAVWKEIRRELATGDRPVRPGGLRLGHVIESDAQDAPKSKENRVSGGGALASAFLKTTQLILQCGQV